MARDYYQWWEVTTDYVQIKFVDTLDSTTLIDANFVLYDDQATPQIISDPFEPIDLSTDYSSISRILTLWWSSPPATGTYSLNINDLKDFLGNLIGDFSFSFDWVLDAATPNQDLKPTRVPVEVEDYSLKTPGWSILDVDLESATPSTFDIIDLSPGVGTHHYVSVQENLGKIDVLFNQPVLTNYITPLYFSLTSKAIQRGISPWTPVDTYVTSNTDSTIVSVYLPASEMATPSVPEYSYLKTEEELEGLVFFLPQTKYRLIINTDVGTA